MPKIEFSKFIEFIKKEKKERYYSEEIRNKELKKSKYLFFSFRAITTFISLYIFKAIFNLNLTFFSIIIANFFFSIIIWY